MPNFTLTSALEASKNGNLKDWIISYLNNEGNNHNLAQIIQDTECKRIELTETALNDLIRICGPEDGMKFSEDAATWESRVTAIQEDIAKGVDLPPLIVPNFWEESEISDGAHRHEALLRNGFTKYWAIFLEK